MRLLLRHHHPRVKRPRRRRGIPNDEFRIANEVSFSSIRHSPFEFNFVIPMPEQTYIHGTEPSEQARLALLNKLTNGPFVEFLQVRPEMRILEVGSGLGLLAAEVAMAADGVE